jgi:hypothetical protein
MADTEFTGTIKLTADTSEAEKKVAQVGKGKAGGGDAAPSSAEVSTLTKRISTVVNDLFGRAGKAATGSMGRTGEMFGNIGALFGRGGMVGGGGAAGAEGAMAALGPVGIGLAAVAGLSVGALAVAESFKALTEKIVDFGRSLASVSPSMAINFAQFDREIMLIKQQIGEALAPMFEDLLKDIIHLFQELAPALILVVYVLGRFVTVMIEGLEKLVKAGLGVAGSVGSALATSAGVLGAGAIGGVRIGAASGGASSFLEDIKEAIREFMEKYQQTENRKLSGMVMTEFMHRINAEGSAQRAYQNAFRQLGPSAAQPLPHVLHEVQPHMVGKAL